VKQKQEIISSKVSLYSLLEKERFCLFNPDVTCSRCGASYKIVKNGLRVFEIGEICYKIVYYTFGLAQRVKRNLTFCNC